MNSFALVFFAIVLFASSFAAPPLDELNDKSFAQNEHGDSDTKNEILLKLKCVREVCESVSNEYHVTELWTKYETYMDINLENMRACPKFSGAKNVEKCFLVKMMSISRVFRVFYTNLLDYLYKAAIQLRSRYIEQCNMTTIEPTSDLLRYLDDPDDTDDDNSGDKLACIKAAIDKVMEENGLEDEWAEYQMELMEVLGALKECKEIEDAIKARECSARESRKGAEIVQRFMVVLLMNGQYDILNKIRIQIAADCVSSTEDKPIWMNEI